MNVMTEYVTCSKMGLFLKKSVLVLILATFLLFLNVRCSQLYLPLDIISVIGLHVPEASGTLEDKFTLFRNMAYVDKMWHAATTSSSFVTSFIQQISYRHATEAYDSFPHLHTYAFTYNVAQKIHTRCTQKYIEKGLCLIAACFKKDHLRIQQALEGGADVNFINQAANCPLRTLLYTIPNLHTSAELNVTLCKLLIDWGANPYFLVYKGMYSSAEEARLYNDVYECFDWDRVPAQLLTIADCVMQQNNSPLKNLFTVVTHTTKWFAKPCTTVAISQVKHWERRQGEAESVPD